MSQNRIKKLLLSEYKEFSDKILIESPFAETTRDGKGLREVALGLTPSKLIIATDVFRRKNDYTCFKNIDPSIESFELVSIYPLEYINLSIFRRRKRKTLKARLVSGKANYYELGGMLRRNLMWKRWCENVQILLSQRENGSSLSETSAASSSSTSTLYFLSSDCDVGGDVYTGGGGDNGRKGEGRRKIKNRIWAHYGAGLPVIWPRKDVYLGPSYNELGYGHYAPIPVRFAGTSLEDLRFEFLPTSVDGKSYHSWPNNDNINSRSRKNQNGGLCDVIFTRENHHRPDRYISSSSSKFPNDYGTCGDHLHNNQSKLTERNSNKLYKQNLNSYQANYNSHQQNFNCHQTNFNSHKTNESESSVALVPKLSRFGFGINENCTSGLYLHPHDGDPDHLVRVRSAYKLMDPYKLIESGVSIWENARKKSLKFTNNPEAGRSRHLRRYGLATSAHFLYALGPWSIHPGDQISIQSRRSSSLATIRKQPIEPELRLPVSKRQLAASVSMTSLEPGMSSIATTTTRGGVILFWTPDYWYRPRAATAAYQELRKHLKLLQDYRIDKNNEKEKNYPSKRNFFTRRNCNKNNGNENISDIGNCDKSSCLLNKLFNMKSLKKGKNHTVTENKSTNQLRKLLKINLKITAWDLDSTTIAKQLTLIDRDLFFRIPTTEVGIIVYKKSSRNSPNIGAWIAFSHRVACLTTSEILAIKKIDMRARILARFINAANKCFAMGNFHSCRSILAGLQSPPIYRLKKTWNYLKTRHATRYDTMGKLCRVFQGIRTDVYKRAWLKAEEYPPLIPYVGDLLIRSLGLDGTEEAVDESPRNNFSIKNYEGGSTFLCQCSRLTKSPRNIDKRKNNNCNEINRREEKNEIGFVKRILSKIIPGKNSTTFKSEYDIAWATRQLILSRKFFDKWQTVVFTSRIIREQEIKRKNINLMKKRIKDVSDWLVRCQKLSQGYEFSGHSLAWEFLLKARYREDRENFILSKKIEPLLE